MNTRMQQSDIREDREAMEKLEQLTEGISAIQDRTSLCWSEFWSWFQKLEPDSDYRICTFGPEKVPWIKRGEAETVVGTEITLHGESHLLYEPVQSPFSAKTGKREELTPSDVNRAVVRCLFKNLLTF